MKYSEHYQWKNKKKFQKDHDKLERLFWKTNNNLSKILNIYHVTNYSKKSWSILLFPWLYHYQSTLYDRWKIFLYEKDKNKKYVFKSKNLSCKSGNDFSPLSQNNNWNNYIYSKIQKFYDENSNKKFSFKNISKKNFKISLYLFYIFKPLKYFLNNSKPFVVDSPNFLSINKIKNIYNYLIIRIINKINQKLYSFYEYDLNERIKLSSLICQLKNNNSKTFENFFYNQVAYDMPCELLEGFKIHLKFSISFPKSNQVFSKFLHFNNFNFKIFLSKFINKGLKINIIEHGGGLPWKRMNFSFEEKIFNKKYCWAKKYDINQKQFLDVSLKKKFYNIYKNSKSKKISIITTIVPKFFLKMSLSKQNFHYNDYILSINNFIRKLKYNEKKNIFLRPHPSENIKYFKPVARVLKKENNIIKFHKKNIGFKDIIHDTKILVCTYPETTFTLSMLSGAPTILLLNKNILELLNPKFTILIRQLIKSKILFSNSLDASRHINKIIDNPYEWFNSKVVKKTRMKYLKLAFGLYK